MVTHPPPQPFGLVRIRRGRFADGLAFMLSSTIKYPAPKRSIRPFGRKMLNKVTKHNHFRCLNGAISQASECIDWVARRKIGVARNARITREKNLEPTVRLELTTC